MSTLPRGLGDPSPDNQEKGKAGVIPATLDELQELIGRGAQLVEVLPEAEYAEAHLPGSINIPLKQLDATTTGVLDRQRPVVVYCWDSL